MGGGRLRWVIGMAGLAVVAALVLWVFSGDREREVRVLVAELDTALTQAVAEEASIGFLPRVEFETLYLEEHDALQVVGRARWFSVGAGAYTLPLIHVRADIPMAPEFWELRDGGVAVAHVRVFEAEQLATATADARPESEANRAGMERLLGRMFGRVAPLGGADVEDDMWRISSVMRDGAEIVFTLIR